MLLQKSCYIDTKEFMAIIVSKQNNYNSFSLKHTN